MSVGEFQRMSRVRRAAVLLGGTSLRVEQIAAQVGYASVKNLYAAMREFTPLSPRALRIAGASACGDLIYTLDWKALWRAAAILR